MASVKTIEKYINQALNELSNFGLLTAKVYNVNVLITWVSFSDYEGFYTEKTNRISSALGYEKKTIYIPMYSTSSFEVLLGNRKKRYPIVDTLRHEYGHAFAVEHPSLIRRNKEFVEVFGNKYDAEVSSDYYYEDFISDYATTSPAEDFAETFACYLRIKGNISKYKSRKGLYRKLRFIKNLSIKLNKNATLMVA